MSAKAFCCPGCGGEISPQFLIPGFSRLTPQQQEIVSILAETPGHFVATDKISARLWADRKVPMSFCFDTQISRIRKKLGRHVIETRKGVGYRLTLDTAPAYVINEV